MDDEGLGASPSGQPCHSAEPKPEDGLGPAGECQAHALRALAERCEQATKSDRDLDDAIAETLFTGKHRVCVKGLSDEAGGMWMFRYPNGSIGSSLRFTGSLDAATTLVPEGSLFTVRTVWDNLKTAGLGFVSRYEKGEFGGHERLYWMDEHQAVAATPALAICAASLRALARDSGSDPTGGDAVAAPGNASQSGGANAAHRPASTTQQDTPQ